MIGRNLEVDDYAYHLAKRCLRQPALAGRDDHRPTPRNGSSTACPGWRCPILRMSLWEIDHVDTVPVGRLDQRGGRSWPKNTATPTTSRLSTGCCGAYVRAKGQEVPRGAPRRRRRPAAPARRPAEDQAVARSPAAAAASGGGVTRWPVTLGSTPATIPPPPPFMMRSAERFAAKKAPSGERGDRLACGRATRFLPHVKQLRRCWWSRFDAASPGAVGGGRGLGPPARRRGLLHALLSRRGDGCASRLPPPAGVPLPRGYPTRRAILRRPSIPPDGLDLMGQRFAAPSTFRAAPPNACLVEPDEDLLFSAWSWSRRSLDLKAGQAVDRVGGMLGLAVSGRAGSLESVGPRDHSGTDLSGCARCMKGADCSLSGIENRCRKMLSTGEAALRYRPLLPGQHLWRRSDGMTEALPGEVRRAAHRLRRRASCPTRIIRRDGCARNTGGYFADPAVFLRQRRRGRGSGAVRRQREGAAIA